MSFSWLGCVGWSKAPNPATPYSFIVSVVLAHMVIFPNINLIIVSGHAIQIKDKDGDELDGFDECSWFYFFMRRLMN
jgi:hypothetical protein